MSLISSYYDPKAADWIAASPDAHRGAIGGLWDELGALQRDFLLAEGLRTSDRLLDLGCGSLRAGVKLVPVLDPGRYYGLDLLQALLDAGYEREIVPGGLADRLPRANLLADDDFDARAFGVTFDVVLAQSLFTHLPHALLIRALEQLEPVTAPGARLFATFFIAPEAGFNEPVRHEPGGVVSQPDRDPFHTTPDRLAAATAGRAWRFEWVKDWTHPRNQKMALFVRL
jgi:SAM-dependent methyltransferase